jgi:hypothetical protein
MFRSPESTCTATQDFGDLHKVLALSLKSLEISRKFLETSRDLSNSQFNLWRSPEIFDAGLVKISADLSSRDLYRH